jgi:hypothetical protein
LGTDLARVMAIIAALGVGQHEKLATVIAGLVV